VAGNITAQPKQGRWAAPISSQGILLCLWHYVISSNQCFANHKSEGLIYLV